MLNIRTAALCAGLLCQTIPTFGQTDGLQQVDDRRSRFLLRLETKGLLENDHVSHHPLSVYEAARHLDSLDVESESLTALDRQTIRTWRGDGQGIGGGLLSRWIPRLYKNGHDFLSVAGEDYALQLNPLMYLGFGASYESARSGRESPKFTQLNTRGVRLSGNIGKFFFESRLTDTRREAPELAKGALIERLGRVNGPNDTDEQLIGAGSLEYFVATGVVGFTHDRVEVRLGRDRNRWGFGMNSLLLSDYSAVYDQLQVRVNVWRLQYVTNYAILTDRAAGRTGLEVPPKYGVFHRLAVNLPGRVRVGLFESVVFTPDDPRGAGSYIGFLNPVIFYRSVDGDIGSPGNVLIGADALWIAHPGYAIYGQLAFDELRVSELFKSRGWWKNTYGYQLGVRLSDVLLEDFDARLEFASIRPYMYSNKTSSLSYLHSRGVLGHASGPNSRDVTAFAEYRIGPRLRLAALGTFTRRGINTEAQNFGSDPSLPYDERRVDESGEPLDFGVETLQGVREDEWLLEGRITYDLWEGASIGLGGTYHGIDTGGEPIDRYVTGLIQFRWGLAYDSLRY